MRYLISVAALTLLLVATPVTAAEHLANGLPSTFTASGDPTGWVRGGYGANTRSLTVITGSPTLLRAEITAYTSGDAKWVSPEVAVSGGQKLWVSHSYRSNVATALEARFATTSGYKYQWLVTLPPTNLSRLTRIERVVEVPTGATSMVLYNVVSSVGFVEVADFRVQDQSISTPMGLLKNGAFLTVDKNYEPVGWTHFGNGTTVRKYTTGLCNVGSIDPTLDCTFDRFVTASYLPLASGEATWITEKFVVPTGSGRKISVAYYANSMSAFLLRVIWHKSDGTISTQRLATDSGTDGLWTKDSIQAAVPLGAVAAQFVFVNSSGKALLIGPTTVDPI